MLNPGKIHFWSSNSRMFWKQRVSWQYSDVEVPRIEALYRQNIDSIITDTISQCVWQSNTAVPVVLCFMMTFNQLFHLIERCQSFCCFTILKLKSGKMLRNSQALLDCFVTVIDFPYKSVELPCAQWTFNFPNATEWQHNIMYYYII